MQQKPRHPPEVKSMDEAWAALRLWGKTAGRKYEVTNRPINRVILTDGTRQVMAEEEDSPDYPHETLIFEAIAIWGGQAGRGKLRKEFIAYVKDAPKGDLAGTDHPGMSLRWWGKDLKVVLEAADEDEAKEKITSLFKQKARLTIQIVQTR